MELYNHTENESGLLKNDNHISCYINSILYILLNLPILSDFLIDNNNTKVVLNNIIMNEKKENIKKINKIIKDNHIKINKTELNELYEKVNDINIDNNMLKKFLNYNEANPKDIHIYNSINIKNILLIH